MKKTLTPLNDVYMRAMLHMNCARDDQFLARNVALIARRAMTPPEFFDVVKT